MLDYCAGAGGKSLALAAAMNNDGLIVAADTDARRLAPLAPRVRRAGATIVESRTIEPGSPVEVEGFDRVLVDAPCSGSGAWRRQPEAPWRLDRARYRAMQASQTGILSAAAPSVAPGGRLIYVTCSLFPAENDEAVRRFLQGNSGFRAIGGGEVWRAALRASPPPGAIDGEFVRLLPHIAGTDAFFVAVMERTWR